MPRNHPSKLLTVNTIILTLAGITACSKNEAQPVGVVKGQVVMRGGQAPYIASVQATASNGQSVTAPVNSWGLFVLPNVPAGPVTLTFTPVSGNYPAFYFPPQPRQVTVGAGDTARVPQFGSFNPLYAEALSATCSWTVNGQHYQGNICRAELSGEVYLPPSLTLQAQIGGSYESLSLAVNGLRGAQQYNLRPGSAGGFLYTPAGNPNTIYDSSLNGSGNVVLTTYDPNRRRIAGTFQFSLNAEPGKPTALGSGAFDLQF